MNRKKNFASGILSGFAILVLILNARCAAESAGEGIDLCLRTVLPSLFPFFVLSAVLNSCLLGKTIPLLRPIGRLCRVPSGGESLLLLGYITGYPVGAQVISQAYRQKSLTARTARRLLGFCNNAGPAFIFGMLSPIFTDKRVPWLLWGIHIVSGIIVGCILPNDEQSSCVIKESSPISTANALQSALRSIATVCGWVVLFRILLGYLKSWFLWRFSTPVQVIISGFFELTNGCVLLGELPSAGLRFIVASGILAFGGLCVGMQTQTVTQGLGIGYYFPGKILQAMLSILISSIMQLFIFNSPDVFSVRQSTMALLIVGVILLICLINRKKVVAFGRRMLYNTHNHSTKEPRYVISKENKPILQLLSTWHRYGR